MRRIDQVTEDENAAAARASDLAARTLVVGIHLLALCLVAASAVRADDLTYTGAGFQFWYPPSWRISAERQDFTFSVDRERHPYALVALEPADGSDASIIVWYRKFPGEINCGGAHVYLEGLVNGPTIRSFFDQVNVTEHLDAGSVFTVKYSRSLREPNREALGSTICRSSGDEAHVLFAYPAGYPRTARDLVMRTFSFSGAPALTGDWNGEGAILTLAKDGTATLVFTRLPFSPGNRGTYRIANGQMVFSWNVVMGTPHTARWDCGYTLHGETVTFRCDNGRTLAFHR